MKSTLRFIICLACIVGLNGSAWHQSTPDKKYSLLFVGNSLTYTNDLPGLVKKYARQKDIKLTTKMLAYPNYAIMDHWEDGKVHDLVASEKYDYVIIQQGPSSQPFGREILFEYGEMFSKLCKMHHAKLCYFMVWPSRTYYQTFDGVIKNHEEAAKANDAILLPVGKVWKAHFDSTSNFDYYGMDGFHPSKTGSEAAAKVIVNTLFDIEK